MRNRTPPRRSGSCAAYISDIRHKQRLRSLVSQWRQDAPPVRYRCYGGLCVAGLLGPPGTELPGQFYEGNGQLRAGTERLCEQRRDLPHITQPGPGPGLPVRLLPVTGVQSGAGGARAWAR